MIQVTRIIASKRLLSPSKKAGPAKSMRHVMSDTSLRSLHILLTSASSSPRGFNNKDTFNNGSLLQKNSSNRISKYGIPRYFSDNLLGYSPMAPQKPIQKPSMQKEEQPYKPPSPIMGVDSNTAGGGVWAQTSAKRDKLGELKVELKADLNQYTLDDLATEEQKLDLFLIDGVSSIVTMIDNGGVYGDLDLNLNNENIVWKEIESVMNDLLVKKGVSIATSSDEDESNKISSLMVSKEEYESHFFKMIEKVKTLREEHPAMPKSNDPSQDESTTDSNTDPIESSTPPPSPLLQMRDFLLYDPPNPDEPIPTNLRQSMYEPVSQSFVQCHEYFQIILVQSALEHLSTQWDELTKVSSSDQDRAATRGDTLDEVKQIDLKKVHDVIQTYASGSCTDRVEALWKLIDRDNDTMIDQEEMDRVIYMSIKPMEHAVKYFLTDCMQVWPMRKMGLPPPLSFEDSKDCVEDVNTTKKKLGFYQRWKQERKERLSKRLLLKSLDGTIRNHFDVEAEIAHRLRCIYAWADKEHQDGKTQSVLVDTNTDASGSGGFSIGSRKRYVELDPKITYAEFSEVQKKHFTHLSRIGQELCTSLKEDLWVHQGKQRQNQELRREVFGFLVVVSFIDYFITIN